MVFRLLLYSKDRTYWDDRVFPAKKGSVSGTITVAHNSNGSKTIAVGFSTRVYIYGSQEYGGSMTLTTIDRSAPTVTFSTSNVTANGFKISATSSATADIWQYSTNGGSSWTQFSTTASTSASVTLSSLSPNTSYTVRVRARRQYNHVYGTSGSSTVKTLGGAVVNSVNTVTADNATVSITINVTVYEASYTNTLVLKNGSTTILTISGLSWSKGTANRTVTLTSAQRTTLLNAMASIKSFTGMAEQESRTISSNIKWAWQRKFQKGDIILNTGLMLGYRKIGKDDEGHDVYEINEEEAEIVRRIYREFIAGYSITQIAKRLQADGVKTKLGRESWRHNVIESILTNEKYTGNALLGKTFKPDVLTKYRQKNDGKKAPIYYVEGSHPAIIEKGLFDLAQQEMQRRRDANDNKVGGGRYSSRYPFSGMLVCGICGSKLRRQVRTMGSGKRTASWGCCNRINNGRAECDSHHVNEEVLEATYLTAMRRLVDSAEEVVEVVRDGTELALEPENKAAMERIDEETIQLQEAALALHKAKQRMEIGAVEYASRVKEYSERMKELEAERNELQGTAAKYAEVRMWLDTFIEQTMQSDTLTTVDGTTMKMLVDRIHVRNDGIVVEFKCGVAIEQEYVK